MSALAFYGTFVHSVSRDEPLVLLQNAYCAINSKGKIEELTQDINESTAREMAEASGVSLHVMTSGQFLMPGFIDTHIHASQYPNAGVGYHLELLDWLTEYTFPLEMRFSDQQFAANVYDKVVRRTLMNGTTTACYYATIHTDSSLILADTMDKYGQRGYVGKVNMDTNSPDGYCETTEQSLEETRKFVNKMLERYNERGLIKPCITPRFALSCTGKLMSSLAEIAKQHDLPIQTHMSENQKEVATVLSVCDVKEYVHVYEKAGLLTPKTILAHCVYLSHDLELDVIKQYESGISHCPNSNVSLNSGDMDIPTVLQSGAKVSLGTDVSGGYSVAVHDAVRKSIETSKHVAMHSANSDSKPIDYRQAFYMATLGGAEVLALDSKIGNFKVGKDFDALYIDINSANSPVDVFLTTDIKELVQKFLYCGDDRNITRVYVAGQPVDLSSERVV